MFNHPARDATAARDPKRSSAVRDAKAGLVQEQNCDVQAAAGAKLVLCAKGRFAAPAALKSHPLRESRP